MSSLDNPYHNLSPKRAVLLFTTGSCPEGFLSDSGLAIRDRMALHTSLNRAARKFGRSIGVDFFDASHLVQVGNRFGERLAYSVQSVLAQGYVQVVVLSNDHFDLTKCDVDDAWSALSMDGVAISAIPAEDGGAALLAIDAVDFDFYEFAQLPWCSGDLYSTLTQTYGDRFLAASDGAKRDLDRASDVLYWRQRRGAPIVLAQMLKRLFRLILGWVRVGYRPDCGLLSWLFFLSISISFRGPPRIL